MSKFSLLSFFLLLVVATAQAGVKLGKISGGELKAIEIQKSEEGDDGSDSRGVFSVVWKKGKIKKSVELMDYSEPTNTADSYSMESASLKDNNITVVVYRQGSYDYRGNSHYTYTLSFDPKTLKFSKVKMTEETDRDVAEKYLRKFLQEKCDPTAPLSEEVQGIITINPREASSLKQSEAYSVLFEEMHACAEKALKAGDKAKANKLIEKALTTPEKGKDWICIADTSDVDSKCPSWKENFLTNFTNENPRTAEDMAHLLTNNQKLSNEILVAVKAAKEKEFPKSKQ
jgi:hypothetical protein